MKHAPKLRSVPPPATSSMAHHFETRARLRFKVLLVACFASQQECADYLKVGLRSVNRYSLGHTGVPGWVLMALEEKAREMRVVVAQPEREAA